MLERCNLRPGQLVLVRNSAVETDLDQKHKPRWLSPMKSREEKEDRISWPNSTTSLIAIRSKHGEEMRDIESHGEEREGRDVPDNPDLTSEEEDEGEVLM
ncbi:hypothetical protein PIIN_10641 [Serendipita indica DSM 11827]|uniref:Uncharacterized protein n=1 Tax=Serendipita indica (strain DSM 11827) TaxID=1109443 RepID=G4TZA8_SERID|nr:hypothetical protein PIIN_10641 [Serendipita indica DSM 11827]